jgi:hypothetical protein
MSVKTTMVNMRHSKLDSEMRFLDRIIKAQDSGLEPNLPQTFVGKDVSKSLTKEWLEKLKACPQCSGDKKRNIDAKPKVVISYLPKRSTVLHKQGVCGKHWDELAETDIGWESGNATFESIEKAEPEL